MAEPYFLHIDLSKKHVALVGRRGPPTEANFECFGSPSVRTIIYSVDATEVSFEVHWLTASPLFFHRRGSVIIAATSLTDIARNSQLRPGREQVTSLIAERLKDGPGYPIFEGIVIAFPGDTASVDLNSGRISVRNPSNAKPASVIPLPASEIEETLIEAIRSRVAGASKVAFAVSGGVDSTTLAALGGKLLSKGPLLCFTARSHGGDDLQFAVQAARDLNADLRIVDAPVGAEALALHSLAVKASCQPIAFSGNSIGFGAICRAARAEGVDVIVDGTGGDPIFGGSYLLHGVPWAWSRGVDRNSKQFEEFVTAFKLAGHTSQQALDSILKDYRESIDYGASMREAITRGRMGRWRSHHVANARAHDINIAMPYLSDDVARYLWHEPAVFFENGWNKAPLRRILARYVSDEIAWRRSDQGLRWPASPFYSANRAAMRRYLTFSRLSRISPGHWMSGVMGTMSDGRLGRFYSAAVAAKAAETLSSGRNP